jgi:hypothetical protein
MRRPATPSFAADAVDLDRSPPGTWGAPVQIGEHLGNRVSDADQHGRDGAGLGRGRFGGQLGRQRSPGGVAVGPVQVEAGQAG